MNPDEESYKNIYKKRVALFSLVVSVALVLVKILIAVLSNSMGVFSEAINNGLDLVAVLITFLAVRIATRPADRDHTYGHGKYENLSAFFEIIIITILCFFIIFRSVQRIILRNFELSLNIYIFIVLAASVVVNIIRVYFIGNAARRYNSMAFKSNFLNYSSDIVSSIIVIIGLYLASKGYPLADPIASIVVALIIMSFSAKLALKVIRNFLDYIPREITEKVAEILDSIPEVKSYGKIRIHEVGDIKFINLDINVDDNIYITQIEKIKEKIKQEITKSLPGSEIVMEIKPAISEDNIDCIVKEVLLNTESVLDIHNIYIYNVGDQIDVSAHIELSSTLNLEESEKLTERTEAEIKEKIKNLRNLYIHIEDAKKDENWDDITSISEQLIEKIKQSISDLVSADTCHKFTVLERNSVYNLAFHCRLDREMEVEKAHSVITEMENRIKLISPSIKEVSIHMEPI
ncbi:MAG: Ferrous-iron efflux pump FieF [Actinobacteria bacterium ADurb.Bin346]|nr:MAG: Ferrous-iron efflux pump FieF [Actinobacteria bacterium ADurb.Bin346]